MLYLLLFEIGMEAYRVLESGNPIQAEKQLRNLKHMIECTHLSIIFGDFINQGDDEMLALLERLESQVNQLIETHCA